MLKFLKHIDRYDVLTAVLYLVFIAMVAFVPTLIYLTLREYNVLEKEGVVTRGIIDNCDLRYVSGYSFKVGNRTFTGTTVRSSIDCHFFCGDTISIIYRPSDPDMNMPACNVLDAYLHESYKYKAPN